MFLRNLMSLDTEEMIKAQPMDAVVLVRLPQVLLFSFAILISLLGLH
jgi:hypothetical protein